MITLTIDNQKVAVEEGTTILEAAEKLGIKIPTLCYLKEINVIGACRICVVEVQGAKAFVPACVAPVAEGMVVRTNTPAVIKARKLILELILSDHPMECLTCVRNQNCELQKLAEAFGITEVRFEGEKPLIPLMIPALPLCGIPASACSAAAVYRFAQISRQSTPSSSGERFQYPDRSGLQRKAG